MFHVCKTFHCVSNIDTNTACSKSISGWMINKLQEQNLKNTVQVIINNNKTFTLHIINNSEVDRPLKCQQILIVYVS